MTSIEDFKQKIKVAIDFLLVRDTFVVLVLICVAFSSFALGRLSALSQKRGEIRFATSSVYNGALLDPTAAFGALSYSKTNANLSGQVRGASTTTTETLVASKNGKKYYFLWCSGANRISKQNAIYFKTKLEAEKAGYTLAASCKEQP